MDAHGEYFQIGIVKNEIDFFFCALVVDSNDLRAFEVGPFNKKTL